MCLEWGLHVWGHQGVGGEVSNALSLSCGLVMDSLTDVHGEVLFEWLVATGSFDFQRLELSLEYRSNVYAPSRLHRQAMVSYSLSVLLWFDLT